MLLLHILIALSSVGFTTYLYFSPSAAKLNASYGLVGLTLATGTYLVISTGAPVLKSCLTGLIYVSVISVIIVAVRSKLATEKAHDK